MKAIFILFFVIYSSVVYSYEASEAYIKEVYKSGFLPRPYGKFSVKVTLDDNDSVYNISINVDGDEIKIPKKQLNKLVDVDLSFLYVGHEIYRSEEPPYPKDEAYLSDYLNIRMQAKEGFSKGEVWYQDYYSVVVNLETRDVKISKFEYERP